MQTKCVEKSDSFCQLYNSQKDNPYHQTNDSYAKYIYMAMKFMYKLEIITWLLSNQQWQFLASGTGQSNIPPLLYSLFQIWVSEKLSGVVIKSQCRISVMLSLILLWICLLSFRPKTATFFVLIVIVHDIIDPAVLGHSPSACFGGAYACFLSSQRNENSFPKH